MARKLGKNTAAIVAAGAAFAGGYAYGYNEGWDKAPKEVISISQEEIVGQFVVNNVVDGDTFDISVPNLEGEAPRIRIPGINTPETYGQAECYGKEASARATELLLDQTVEIQVDELAGGMDRHGRLLRTVTLTNRSGEADFEKLMVREGYAAAYREYRTTDRTDLIALEAEARSAGRGMWGACDIQKVPADLSSGEVEFPES